MRRLRSPGRSGASWARWGGPAALLALLVAFGPAADAPVADAAQRGDVGAVRDLLRAGADVNAAQGDGMTALHWAAERGDTALASVLLYAGAARDPGTRLGRYTPLHLAARVGNAGMVRRLVAAGAEVGAETTNSGVQPIHLAAASGDGASLLALLDAGADPDVREGTWGQTPLTFAAARGRVATLSVLLQAGADPALTSWSVDAAEHERADRAAERRLREFLEDFKEKEGGGTDWKPTPSQVQAAIQASRQIQRRWPDVPDPDQDDEEAPADSAVAADSAEADSTAVAEGGDDESGEDSGEDEDGDEDEEPRPLSYGQMVDAWGGLTPLLHAVRQGHAEAVHVLLDGGADIDQPSAGDSTTPLLMAAVNGQFDLALELLDRGADPNLLSTAGAGPLFGVLERQWAPRASYAHPTQHQRQRATHLDVLRALLEAGADPNARLNRHLWYMEYTFQVLRGSGIDMQGATPFWRAAYALDVEAMRLLKEFGADPSIATTKPPERRRRAQAGQEPKPDTAAADSAAVPQQVNAEGEGLATQEPGEDPEEDEDKDHSGVPPVPVGGPALYPLHAATGAGYGQSFAGNAHRTVPDNWLAAVRFLVEECGADVNLRDHNAYTPLHHAASRGDNEVIRYLVEQGADVTPVSRKGETTADMANGPVQRVPPYPATIELLVSLGAVNNDNCVSCEE